MLPVEKISVLNTTSGALRRSGLPVPYDRSSSRSLLPGVADAAPDFGAPDTVGRMPSQSRRATLRSKSEVEARQESVMNDGWRRVPREENEQPRPASVCSTCQKLIGERWPPLCCHCGGPLHLSVACSRPSDAADRVTRRRDKLRGAGRSFARSA